MNPLPGAGGNSFDIDAWDSFCCLKPGKRLLRLVKFRTPLQQWNEDPHRSFVVLAVFHHSAKFRDRSGKHSKEHHRSGNIAGIKVSRNHNANGAQ